MTLLLFYTLMTRMDEGEKQTFPFFVFFIDQDRDDSGLYRIY